MTAAQLLKEAQNIDRATKTRLRGDLDARLVVFTMKKKNKAMKFDNFSDIMSWFTAEAKEQGIDISSWPYGLPQKRKSQLWRHLRLGNRRSAS